MKMDICYWTSPSCLSSFYSGSFIWCLLNTTMLSRDGMHSAFLWHSREQSFCWSNENAPGHTFYLLVNYLHCWQEWNRCCFFFHTCHTHYLVPCLSSRITEIPLECIFPSLVVVAWLAPSAGPRLGSSAEPPPGCRWCAETHLVQTFQLSGGCLSAYCNKFNFVFRGLRRCFVFFVCITMLL